MSDKPKAPALYLQMFTSGPTRNQFTSSYDGKQLAYVHLMFCSRDASTGKPTGVDWDDPLREFVFTMPVSDLTTREDLNRRDGRFGPDIYSSREHPLGLREMERAVKILKRGEAALAKASDKLGSPKSFGQFVMYIAQAFGVVGILARSEYDKEYWGEYSGAGTIDNAVYQAVVACRKAAGKDGAVPATRESEASV